MSDEKPTRINPEPFASKYGDRWRWSYSDIPQSRWDEAFGKKKRRRRKKKGGT